MWGRGGQIGITSYNNSRSANSDKHNLIFCFRKFRLESIPCIATKWRFSALPRFQLLSSSAVPALLPPSGVTDPPAEVAEGDNVIKSYRLQTSVLM